MKRIVSILLSVILITSTVLISGVTPVSAETETVTTVDVLVSRNHYDESNVTYTNSGILSSSAQSNVYTTRIVNDDSTIEHFSYWDTLIEQTTDVNGLSTYAAHFGCHQNGDKATNIYPNVLRIYDSTSETLEQFIPKANTTYTIKLSYNSLLNPNGTSSNKNLSLSLMYANKEDSSVQSGYAADNVIIESLALIKDVTDGWQTVEATFTTGDTVMPLLLILQTDNNKWWSTNVDVWIDDIELYEKQLYDPEMALKTVKNHYDESNVTYTNSGELAIDSSTNVYTTRTVNGDSTIEHFSYWDTLIEQTTDVNGLPTYAAHFGCHQNGEKATNVYPNILRIYDSRNVNLGQFIPEPNSTYTIKLSYNALLNPNGTSSNKNLSLSLMYANKTDSNEQSGYVADNIIINDLVLIKDATNGWQTVEATFSTGDTVMPLMLILLTDNNKWWSTNVDVWVDDIEIINTSESEEFFETGDVNTDGTVDIRDLVALKKMSADMTTDTAYGDVNMDGTISAAEDLTELRQMLLGYETWRSHPEDFKLIAFTFDDGPDVYTPSVTKQVADIIKANKGSATFFFIGEALETENAEDIANYVLSQGSEVASHSYTHANASTIASMTDEDFYKEIDGNNELIKQLTGVDTKFFRGGGYAYSEKIYARLEELNMPAIGSYMGASDYSGGTATVSSLVSSLLASDIPDGAIVGLHSSNETNVTPKALEIVLPILYRQGYRFCTLSELLEYKGVDYAELPSYCYITRVETLADGTPEIHTNRRIYSDSWRSHPEDYKLLAFTFDDGPNSKDTRMVDLFAKYNCAATFFVTGSSISTAGYDTLQYAIDKGWDIGNHTLNHVNAKTGGTDGGELTYEEIKYEIEELAKMLEENLTDKDGNPYKTMFYRPTAIATTENVFKVAKENNFPIIWLSQNTFDWSSSYTDEDRLQHMKNGIGVWEDGDVILGHIWSNNTYDNLVATLEDFWDAGYRFCSLSEILEYRNIDHSCLVGELNWNETDGNNGMVKNIVKAATYGQKE